MNQPLVEIRTSPHIHSSPTVAQIMRNVTYALMPLVAFAVFQFGISALALIVTVVTATLLTESLFAKLSGRENTIFDSSAAITGLLLALTLPPGFPLWMGAVAGFIAIALGKTLFGGIGFNLFNPALIGRAFVQAAFPVAITTWSPAFAPGRFVEFIPSTLTMPLMRPADLTPWIEKINASAGNAVDAFSGATPLAAWKFDGIATDSMDLLTGMVTGSSGETSALLILLCGGYLVLRKMMNWRIPATVLAGAFITALLLFLFDSEAYPDPLFVLFSGGLMLGAIFMASDMVGSPVTPLGVLIYGLLIGFFTVIIRTFGGLPEGVMYAILLGNALTPLIESVTQPRVYGDKQKKGNSA
ncbi:RnfABCDGE type electron transport complex subunit D [Candidatus Venteria ishoeyi]|uniref:Ion-translocating oxidoreductase complex subunit D n=1 Tax=Candidatus Venteria ishoeyi TaxID=1899563 RepID=A0A1H6FCG1_9GAMM|nr:RnfABCDGE type electron transport complex subunit D [Candidatus Venteria ishoeyi]MDM8544968.1 RnfABCDGE type electron transport complex subunit D [Candidatus Venteria ishoeyi]SEH07772.1 Electron transport complex protein RnfD [Candidatus Venteria ishoeyi]